MVSSSAKRAAVGLRDVVESIAVPMRNDEHFINFLAAMVPIIVLPKNWTGGLDGD